MRKSAKMNLAPGFVNGRQIKSTALHDADRIIMGTTNLEFQLI